MFLFIFIGVVKPQYVPYVMSKIDYGFSIVENTLGTSGQKLRQYLMSGCSVFYSNDEFFEQINLPFVNEYISEIDTARIIMKNIGTRKSSREEIAKWAITNLSYSGFNKKRMAVLGVFSSLNKH